MRRLIALLLIVFAGAAHTEAPSLPWQKWDPVFTPAEVHRIVAKVDDR